MNFIDEIIVEKGDKNSYEKYMKATLKEKWQYNYEYELYGIVVHSGSMSGGHYIAYVWYK